MLILTAFCGEEWMEKNIYLDKVKFLGAPENEERTNLIMMRVISLAQMMINLQYEPGFFNWLQSFIKEEVEPYFAELEAASFLRMSKIDFKFHKASGKPDCNNYDLAIYKKGLQIATEVKCRLERSDKSTKGILNRLIDARKKLPKNGPSIILVRLPQKWYSPIESDDLRLAERTVEDFLLNTTRIISVIIIGEMIETKPEYTAIIPFSKEITNKRQNFGCGLAPILGSSALFPHNWLIFSSFLGYTREPGYSDLEIIKGRLQSITKK